MPRAIVDLPTDDRVILFSSAAGPPTRQPSCAHLDFGTPAVVSVIKHRCHSVDHSMKEGPSSRPRVWKAREREPRAGMGSRPTERGSEIPRGTLVGGCGRYAPRALSTLRCSSTRCKQMAPLTVCQPLRCHAARLGRCIDVHRTMPSVIPHVRVGCRPTQKAHFCDRHHIASAVCGASFVRVECHVRRFFLKTQPRLGGAFSLRRSTSAWAPI